MGERPTEGNLFGEGVDDGGWEKWHEPEHPAHSVQEYNKEALTYHEILDGARWLLISDPNRRFTEYQINRVFTAATHRSPLGYQTPRELDEDIASRAKAIEERPKKGPDDRG